MRLASATTSSERLFCRLEGLSAIARVEPGAKIAAFQPFPTGLTSMRCPLYLMAVIAHRGSLHFNLKRARASSFEAWRPKYGIISAAWARRKYSPAPEWDKMCEWQRLKSSKEARVVVPNTRGGDLTPRRPYRPPRHAESGWGYALANRGHDTKALQAGWNPSDKRSEGRVSNRRLPVTVDCQLRLHRRCNWAWRCAARSASLS
jgi:hypothetical protein